MKKLLLALPLLISSLSGAEQQRVASATPPPQIQASTAPSQGYALKEIGLTIGTPAALNINLGFWGTESLPLLVRASGMYYGKIRGLQTDLGLVSNGGSFKPFLAATFTKMEIDTDSQQLSYTGIGPSAGFNVSGFQLQLGLAFPLGTNNFALNATDGLRGLDKQITLQIGYSFIW